MEVLIKSDRFNINVSIEKYPIFINLGENGASAHQQSYRQQQPCFHPLAHPILNNLRVL